MKRIYTVIICAVVLLMSGCSQTAQKEINKISSTENLTILDTTEDLQTSEDTTASVTEDTAADETTPISPEKDNLTEEVEYTLFTDKVNNLDGVTATVKESTSTTITIELSNTTSLEILYGNEFGKYTSPVGVPYEQRALPYIENPNAYHQYEVLKPIDNVTMSQIASAFEMPGGGIQYELPSTIEELIKSGFLKELT